MAPHPYAGKLRLHAMNEYAMSDYNRQRPEPVRVGYELLWQTFALLALLAVPVLFVGGLWLMFQDYSYAEGMAVRIMVPTVLIGALVIAWRKRRNRAS